MSIGKRTAALACLLLLFSTQVQAANKLKDRVQGLPNVVNPLPSKWYSGYLSVTQSKALHYVLVESLNNVTTDPLLLWFNGGPGCSSMEGLFAELGPFIFDDGENIIKPNPYPWNMNASVLYIESPAGVGFSIANNTDDFKHSDISQSEDLFAGLQDFFNAFPDMRANEIYITGESYAGVYVPYLAWQIHEWNLAQEMYKQFNNTYNLKGFIVGNGVTDNYIDTDNQLIESITAWSMIPRKLMDQINANGCIFYWDAIDLQDNNPAICDGLHTQALAYIQDFNIYDLYRTQYPGTSSPLSKERKVSPTQKHFLMAKLRSEKLKDSMGSYLNRTDVRQQLNIPSFVQTFYGCSDEVGQYYLGLREASIWIYNILLGYPARYRLMHYSGDTDGAVATLGTRRWIKQQPWPVTNEWRPWTTNGDLSGYLEDRGNFTFATIHGVGHMAPQWKRQAVTQLITRFTHNLPLDQE